MDTSAIEIRVRYAETDRMGRAHHTHHLTWCEAARTAWLRKRGVSYADLEAAGVFLPVSRAELDYRKPVTYDQRVRITTWPDRARSRSVTFRYDLERVDDDEPVARAEIVLVCVDEDGQVRRIPEEVRSLLESATSP